MDDLSVSTVQAALTTSGSGSVSNSRLTSEVKSTGSEGTRSASFADMLSTRGQQLVGSITKAEAMAVSGIKGEATAYEVATAVMHGFFHPRQAGAVLPRNQPHADLTSQEPSR